MALGTETGVAAFKASTYSLVLELLVVVISTNNLSSTIKRLRNSHLTEFTVEG